MSPAAPGDGAFVLDRRAVRRSFGRAAASYDGASEVQKRVRVELLERLELVRIDPAAVLDLGSGTGHAAQELQARYPRGQVVALDIAESMLLEAGRRRKPFGRVCADAAALPFRSGSFDIVMSSLMLQWCNDPDQVFAECRRVLRPGGLLSFATFGPDTLIELRRAWKAADGRVHVSRFIDMHDLGDALMRAGMAEPVMDVDRLTLSYGEVRDLMTELKAIGAHNASAGRPRGLTGKGAMARMLSAYENLRCEAGLPATYEVVYGQAWRPESEPSQRDPATGEVRVPLVHLGRRNRLYR
jgi:malonyl-CoA O-methyltransferase